MDEHYVGSEKAAEILGVSRPTLYAYVSRGMVQTMPNPEEPRRQLYDARELNALARQKRRGRKPREAAAAALDWGLPVLDTSLSHLDGRKLYYRGRDAAVLSGTASLEETARLLWGCNGADPFQKAHGRKPEARHADLPLFARCEIALSSDHYDAPTMWRRDPRTLWTGAANIVKTLATVGIGSPLPALPVHDALGEVWQIPHAAGLLRRALVLVADHELNASAFAVRVIASTGASLPNAVLGGLASLSGPRHGGQIAMVENLFEQAEQVRDMHAFIDERLRRGEGLPGFGHPLYLDGDCRATELLRWLPEDPLRMDLVRAVLELSGHRPNIDFALVAMRRSLGLPGDAALFLFLLGRSVGWIAHAFEQQLDGRVIRPRASYVGETA